MSCVVVGYHKLKKKSDFDKINVQSNGANCSFRHSKPAEEHWLGEGVYFFLDPNGYNWAVKWPMSSFKPQTGSKHGIIRASIDTEFSIDLRIDEQRALIKEIIDELHLKLTLQEKKKYPVKEGELFFLLFKRGLIEEKVNFVPTAFIANFDIKYEKYRLEHSQIFLSVEKCEINSETAHIQICIIDNRIINDLNLVAA